MKSQFFILRNVIFLVRLAGNFDIVRSEGVNPSDDTVD